MRLLWWNTVRVIGMIIESIGWSLREWGWDHYWYGPKGAGKDKHPDIASVKNNRLIYYWRRRYDD